MKVTTKSWGYQSLKRLFEAFTNNNTIPVKKILKKEETARSSV